MKDVHLCSYYKVRKEEVYDKFRNIAGANAGSIVKTIHSEETDESKILMKCRVELSDGTKGEGIFSVTENHFRSKLHASMSLSVVSEPVFEAEMKGLMKHLELMLVGRVATVGAQCGVKLSEHTLFTEPPEPSVVGLIGDVYSMDLIIARAAIDGSDCFSKLYGENGGLMGYKIKSVEKMCELVSCVRREYFPPEGFTLAFQSEKLRDNSAITQIHPIFPKKGTDEEKKEKIKDDIRSLKFCFAVVSTHRDGE